MNKVQEAFDNWIESHKKDFPQGISAMDKIMFKAGYESALSEIDKCEPVAEALHERNRLGYAVVDVIGALDEIIENAQEVEVDDFLHIAIPIDKWHELQDALEEMPKRAELYTSPQAIDKCAPVYLIVSGADEIVVTKEKYDSWTSAKRISYTSPISKDITDWQYFDEAYKKATESSEPDDWMNAALMAQQVRRKQLNAEKG